MKKVHAAEIQLDLMKMLLALFSASGKLGQSIRQVARQLEILALGNLKRRWLRGRAKHVSTVCSVCMRTLLLKLLRQFNRFYFLIVVVGLPQNRIGHFFG